MWRILLALWLCCFVGAAAGAYLGYQYRNYELAVQRANIQQTENMI